MTATPWSSELGISRPRLPRLSVWPAPFLFTESHFCICCIILCVWVWHVCLGVLSLWVWVWQWRQRWTSCWLPPSCLPSSRTAAEHLWESHCWLDRTGRESGLSQHLKHLLPSLLCSQLSQKIIILIYWSQKSPPSLDILSYSWQIASAFSSMFV